jgi:hypothetical protein
MRWNRALLSAVAAVAVAAASAFAQTAPPTGAPAASTGDWKSCAPEFIERWKVAAKQHAELSRIPDAYFEATLSPEAREWLCRRTQEVLDLEKKLIIEAQANAASCVPAAKALESMKTYYNGLQVTRDNICSDFPLRLRAPCPWPTERAGTACKFSWYGGSWRSGEMSLLISGATLPHRETPRTI